MLPATRTDLSILATETQVLQALASLAVLPSRQAEDAALDQDMYRLALRGVSRHGLSQAVSAIMRGALGHTFFPSPVELRQQCDAAEEPLRRQIERDARRREWARENAEYARARAHRSPEAVARQQAAYKAFCESYAQEPIAQERVYLDPELMAQVPDAPTKIQETKGGVNVCREDSEPRPCGRYS